MRSLVAEAARHAAAGGIDHFDLELRHERKRPLHRRHRAEGLLVAVAVHERTLFGERFQRERESPGFALAREEFLEEQRLTREGVGVGAREHRLEFIAQGQQARGLQADDSDFPLHVGLERGEHALRFGLCFVHHPGRKERAPAAQRP